MTSKKKRRGAEREFADTGTPELSRQFSVVPKLSGLYTMTGKVIDETEIDRLLLADRITAAQHAALENFMSKLHAANFVGVKSPDYSSRIHLDPSAVGRKRAERILRVVKIFQRLDGKPNGRAIRVSLVNLCLLDKEWPGTDDMLHRAIEMMERAICGD